MKLDRDINETGKGKYALINMRKIDGDPRTPEELAAPSSTVSLTRSRRWRKREMGDGRLDEIAARLEAVNSGNKLAEISARGYMAGDVAFLLAEVKRLEDERDAAYRTIADAVANNIGHETSIRRAEWVSKHSAVIEAACKIGDE